MEVGVHLLPNAMCKRPDWYGTDFQAKTMMCAGFMAGAKDSCEGDSGGPLQCRPVHTQRWRLVGVVSWGESCGGKKRPGVYARITTFLPWIKSHIKRIFYFHSSFVMNITSE